MFKKTKPGPEPDPTIALEARLATLEREFKTLETEWTEMYDKFRRLHMRLAKRDQRAQDAPQDTNGKQGEGSPPPPMNPMAARLLGSAT